MSPLDDDPVYTPNEVAASLRIPYRTVIRHIKSGRLKATLVGRHYLIRRSAIDAFVPPVTSA